MEDGDSVDWPAFGVRRRCCALMVVAQSASDGRCQCTTRFA
jgi:hypothetical protein